MRILTSLYIFASPSGIQTIISASPNVEITSPGVGLVDFLTPAYKSRGQDIVVTRNVCITKYTHLYKISNGKQFYL